MCSIKAVAMCLQGKGTFHWNQFLFIALPTVNNFSPLKAGRIAWAKENGQLQMCCSYLHMYAAMSDVEQKSDEGHVHMFTHTHTHTHPDMLSMSTHVPWLWKHIWLCNECPDAHTEIHRWNSTYTPVMYTSYLLNTGVQMDSPMHRDAFYSLFKRSPVTTLENSAISCTPVVASSAHFPSNNV